MDTFSDGLLMGFTQFFTGVITILGTLAFMIVLDWRIADGDFLIGDNLIDQRRLLRLGSALLQEHRVRMLGDLTR